MTRRASSSEACAPSGHAAVGDHVAPQRAVERAAALFRALGDASRIRLVERLLSGDRCVGDLASETTTPMSTVSQQLRLLRAEGIVSRRRVGKHIYYALADGAVSEWVRAALGRS